MAQDDLTPPADRLADERQAANVRLIDLIARVDHRLDAAIRSCLKPYGLRVGELTLLIALRRAGEPCRLTPSELCREMMVTSGGATRRIDQLEGRGLVERTPHPHDRRGCLVGLTPAGRRLVEDSWGDHLRQNGGFFDALDTEERRVLAEMLGRVLLANQRQAADRTAAVGEPARATGRSRDSGRRG